MESRDHADSAHRADDLLRRTGPGPSQGYRPLMFDSILVVGAGDVCRSPGAGAMLMRETQKKVSSAGLVALVDHDMDALAREVALSHGLECPAHSARKLTREMCRDADLILVMETRQRDRVAELAPEAS